MYSNWIWVSKKYKISFQTSAGSMPPKALKSKHGTWVAFKAQETPPIETVDISGKSVIINGKKYPIVKQIVV